MNIEPHRPDGFGCSHVLSAFFAANSLNHTGSALLGSIVSGFVVVLSLAYLGMAVTGSSRVGKDTRQLLLAEAYSAELLEFFLSHDTSRLKDYLSKNPVKPNYPPYPLCSPINLADPDGGNVLNRDPLAELPSLTLPNANRFYRVEVVSISDPTRLTSRRELCGSSPKNLTLAPDERFLITVGMSWSNADKSVERTVLSGIVRSNVMSYPPVVPAVAAATPAPSATPSATSTPSPSPTPAASCRSGDTFWLGPKRDQISYWVNDQYGRTVIPVSGKKGYATPDSATRNKICELAGYPSVRSYTTLGYASCTNNVAAMWNGGAWVIRSACGYIALATITCRCP